MAGLASGFIKGFSTYTCAGTRVLPGLGKPGESPLAYPDSVNFDGILIGVVPSDGLRFFIVEALCNLESLFA